MWCRHVNWPVGLVTGPGGQRQRAEEERGSREANRAAGRLVHEEPRGGVPTDTFFGVSRSAMESIVGPKLWRRLVQEARQQQASRRLAAATTPSESQQQDRPDPIFCFVCVRPFAYACLCLWQPAQIPFVGVFVHSANPL
ncbi:unnamed protein product [Protopolystoma xenopodis]|uniref:Uncharacterized protein n=1 Tax=Protopolystoma xenopodis TaxID=117903 RepID=A0A3S5FEG4_9PLAT|nr:unnamed protein product [Protopolystoma xenopodis]